MRRCSDFYNSLAVQIVAYVVSVLGTNVLNKFSPGCPQMVGLLIVSMIEHVVAKVSAETFL